MRIGLVLLALIAAFAADAPVLEYLRHAPDFVARFAAGVTWIGKTDWQAVVLILVMLVGALARPDGDSDGALRAEQMLRLAAACFLLILLTGIAAQGLKALFGRPRPAELGPLPPLTFAPFGFRPNWNAFPSGHSTTMGALAVLAARVWPRAWFAALVVALTVGASRVLVGAHYPSDVVAGLALGAGMSGWIIETWRRAGVFDPRAPLALPRAGLAPLAGLRAIPRILAAMLVALVPRRG